MILGLGDDRGMKYIVRTAWLEDSGSLIDGVVYASYLGAVCQLLYTIFPLCYIILNFYSI